LMGVTYNSIPTAATILYSYIPMKINPVGRAHFLRVCYMSDLTCLEGMGRVGSVPISGTSSETPVGIDGSQNRKSAKACSTQQNLQLV
ncbi:MAG: hypothetical protein WA855_07420, partial [Candidatus Acidiferrales bacterium]